MQGQFQQQGITKCPYLPKAGQLPSNIEQTLPKDVATKIKHIQCDQKAGPEQKMNEVDALMVDLPDELLDKIPEPPKLAHLPEDVKQRLRMMKHQSGKPFTVKFKEFLDYVDTLPSDTKCQVQAAFQQ